MNAESYLRKQGWKGSGHSLDSTGRGIKKPLLIAHKQDQLGLGKKKAAYTTDDQWWMRAFDQSLQSIGTGQESTLNQIRTKGINRGGLYGFFVKGEAIAGTMDDASTDATDASVPPSGASTPPTSASDSESPAEPAKKAEKSSKRKRDEDDILVKSKKARKERRAKRIPRDPTKSKHGRVAATPAEQDAVDRKIAKLSPRKRAWYEEHAAKKGQTLEQYLVRRVQKAAKKLAKRNKRKAADPAPTFVVDLEGDATSTALGNLTIVGETADSILLTKKADKDQRRKEKKEAKKALRSEKAHSEKKIEFTGKDDFQKAVKEKKEEKKEKKKAKKAEQAKSR